MVQNLNYYVLKVSERVVGSIFKSCANSSWHVGKIGRFCLRILINK